MLRTVSVLIAGTLLALAVLIISFLLIVNYVPEQFNWYAYFLLKALVGAAIGLFVGFFQRRNSGLVAVICLLPALLLQATSRSYPVRTGRGFAVLLLSEALGLSIAFMIAHRLSDSRTGSRATASSI